MAKDSIEKDQHDNTNSGVEAIPVVTAGAIADGQLGTETIVEDVEEQPETSKAGDRHELIKSATLTMLGSLGTSLMGMVRQIVIAATGDKISGSFQAAYTPAQTFNDLLATGTVSSALIPTFNDYAAPDKREELRRLVFTVVNLVIIIMLAASIIFFFIAPWFIDLLVGHYKADSKDLTIQSARIIFFALIAFGPFSVLQAALYARKEFGWPAFASVAIHLGIILGAIVGSILGVQYLGQYGMAVGVVVGGVGELLLLIPGMRHQQFKYMFVLDLKHPALRHILRLYAPVALSFAVSMVFTFLDQWLTTNAPCPTWIHGVKYCSEANLSAMRFSTTLIQFPIGLVAAALSYAILPTLTTYAREGEMERFKDMLLLGFRLGLFLMIPAMAGLIVLQEPIVRTIFEHGAFSDQDGILASVALQNYAYQLPFVAIDQLLIAAFYARKQTLIPVLTGFAGYIGYLAVALPFSHTIGMPALAFANAAQNILRAVVLLIVIRMVIGSIHFRKAIPTILKIILATLIMSGVAWGLQMLLGQVPLFSLNYLPGRLLTLLVAGGIGMGVYFGGALVLKVEEINMLKGTIMAKLGKK
ncbi:hypothetical protein EPA93_26790 [Ktedonosporobacter rubrisoli]|uniref:Lipid II flippase MurJ n=1 Tax=Ktedonosporobacter rubrisoli TaxID=2509675 RepID=A0A4P6JUS8_KTERU|nr:lipid II flippase MurJ [Ktedonosporobacter rubrisoli]QBD79399.1 hypothetical protein EPA93_26790 [Ktedonosporobacter rubrisoli]